MPSKRGNPNLNLSPRCSAKTRTGCPCRAPAIRGKKRCRMHGGRSIGPRTEQGRARIAAARTTHGRYTGLVPAHLRQARTILQRSCLLVRAIELAAWLPDELRIRLRHGAFDLLPPPFACGLITRQQDRALARAERQRLTPWRDGMAVARANRRAARKPHAPERASAAPAAAVPARQPEEPAAEKPPTPEHVSTAPGAAAPLPARRPERPADAPEPATAPPPAQKPHAPVFAYAPRPEIWSRKTLLMFGALPPGFAAARQGTMHQRTLTPPSSGALLPRINR